MELADGGNLSTFMKKLSKSMSQEEIITILHQIVKGLEYLHSKNILHRDLKAENILLCGGFWKLADFGTSRKVEESLSKGITFAGSPAYMAPEIMSGYEDGFSIYEAGLPSDIWSLGVMIYQIITQEFPFPGKSCSQLLRSIKSQKPNPLPPPFQGEFQELLNKMLQIDPVERIKISDILSSPLFSTLK